MREIPKPATLLEMVKTSPNFATATDDFARVYRFAWGDDDAMTCNQFGAFPDIYEGLTQLAITPDPNNVALAIATQGWAVPNDPNADPDLAPSERPDRVRVSLLAVVDVQQRHAARIHMIESGQVLDGDDENGEAAGGQLLDAMVTALQLSRVNLDEARAMIEATLRDIENLNGGGSPF